MKSFDAEVVESARLYGNSHVLWFRPSDALQSLTPGQFVNISLRVDQLQNALIVPTAAVQIGPNGNFVFVVKPDHTVDQRVVQVHIASGEETVLASGVNVGETVVTDGQSRLKPGSKVELFAHPEQLGLPGITTEAPAGAPTDAKPPQAS